MGGNCGTAEKDMGPAADAHLRSNRTNAGGSF